MLHLCYLMIEVNRNCTTTENIFKTNILWRDVITKLIVQIIAKKFFIKSLALKFYLESCRFTKHQGLKENLYFDEMVYNTNRKM